MNPLDHHLEQLPWQIVLFFIGIVYGPFILWLLIDWIKERKKEKDD